MIVLLRKFKKAAAIGGMLSICCILGPISVANAIENKKAADDVDPIASILPYVKQSFSPVHEETFSIPLEIRQPEKITDLTVEIRTVDNDLVNTLQLAGLEKGKTDYELKWNGRDQEDALVPDEAYVPILVVTDAENRVTRLDPRSHSGGEEVYDFDKAIHQGAIEYKLPVASRMLIRSGIKNGPMLRTIIDWQPRAAGFHAERWNGHDEDNVVNIEHNPQVGYLIIGYQLSDHTIITYGNSKESYRAYRERRKWPLPQPENKGRPGERGGKLIRPEFYTPILQQKSPHIAVNMVDKATGRSATTIRDMDEVLTEVKLDPLDELYLDQERYEITFFVDNEFIAEEEQGFVPFTWRWSPGRYGIKPGEHVLTINVSGYNGQVGVRNIAFTLQGAPALTAESKDEKNGTTIN